MVTITITLHQGWSLYTCKDARYIMHGIVKPGVNFAIACKRKDAIAMKIESSAVQMDATYSASKVSVIKYSSDRFFSLATPQSASGNVTDNRSYSSGNPTSNGLAEPSTLIYIPVTNQTLSVEESFHDLNRSLLRHIIEMMHEMLKGNNFLSQTKSDFLTSDGSSGNSSTQIWYRTERTDFFYSEAETTTFDTKGLVKTSDGREISFDLSLSMSRSFMEETHLEQRIGDVMTFYDPLVINMDVPTAAVTNQKFLFDIDSNGTQEQISTLSKGSGFLALDKNGDGIINDGSELFGTESGDGFKDLAAYDMDGNGWIDENDSIYENLRVWTKDYEGKDTLLSLKEADIGAIYLGHVSTGFDLKDAETNDTNARIQSTGIYLHESTGEAGTIQHVDFSA